MSTIAFIVLAVTGAAILTLVVLALRLRVGGRLGRIAVLAAWLIFAAFLVVVWIAGLIIVSRMGGVWAMVATPFVLIGLTALSLGLVRVAWRGRQRGLRARSAFPEPEA